MSKDNKRLGKGLEALFNANSDLNLGDMVDVIEDAEGYTIRNIDIEKMRPNPYQPRKEFDEVSLEELAHSIKEHGILQPLVVRKSELGFEILAGERRFRAAKLANLKTVPVVIKQFTDNEMMELAILENIQREDLNIIEEANGYQTLLNELQWTQVELSQRMGKSRSHITNILRLLELPKEVQKLLSENKISMGHAKVLVNLEAELITKITTEIMKQGLSVRATEQLVKKIKKTHINTSQKKAVSVSNHSVETAFITEELIHFFGTPVEITNNKLSISFSDTQELNNILLKIGVIKE